MTDPNINSHLSRIVTDAPLVDEALRAPITEPTDPADHEARQAWERDRSDQLAAREWFLKRYQVAVHGFLGAMLRDPAAVAEVWSLFVEKWLSGKLRGFDPAVGRFHIYLKRVLRNEVFAHWRRVGRERELGPGRLETGQDPAAELDSFAGEAFDRGLREGLVERSLEAVRAEDELFHATLELLMNSPIKPSARAIADRLEEVKGVVVSETNARQIKKRAKEFFAHKLVVEIGELVGERDLTAIERAAEDLDMIDYCRKAIDAMRR